MLLTATPKRVQPGTHHLSPERLQGWNIAGDSEVPEVPRHHPTQPLGLLVKRPVTPSVEDVADHPQPSPHPLLRRLPLYQERSRQSLHTTTVGEAQEVERLRLPVAPLLSVADSEPSKLDQSRLVGVQHETELLEAIVQIVQEPLGFVTMLESQ